MLQSDILTYFDQCDKFVKKLRLEPCDPNQTEEPRCVDVLRPLKECYALAEIGTNPQRTPLQDWIGDCNKRNTEEPRANKPTFRKRDAKNPGTIEEMMELVPSVQNHFIVKKRIGFGTFSSVFHAKTIKRNKENKRDHVALKHVYSSPTDSQSSRKRLLFEVKCLREIGGCNNVVGLDRVVVNGRDHVLVMPYYDHDRYNVLINELTFDGVREYMKNLLIAVRRVHKHNVIHRDVKPGNFLFDRNAKCYALVDFGLAHNAPFYRPSVTSPTTSPPLTIEPIKSPDRDFPTVPEPMTSPGRKASRSPARKTHHSPSRGSPMVTLMPIPIVPISMTSFPIVPVPMAPIGMASIPVPAIPVSTVPVQPMTMMPAVMPPIPGPSRKPSAPKGSLRRSSSMVAMAKNIQMQREKARKRRSDGAGEPGAENPFPDSASKKVCLTPDTQGTPDSKPSKCHPSTPRPQFQARSMLGVRAPTLSIPNLTTSSTRSTSSEVTFTSPTGGGSTGGHLAGRAMVDMLHGVPPQAAVGWSIPKKPSVYVENKTDCGCIPGQRCRRCTGKSKGIPRAGTSGFRAPEVLIKCPHQTTAVDVWAVGVMFISLLSGRYPFFKPAEDMESLVQLIGLFGSDKMRRLAKRCDKKLTASFYCAGHTLRSVVESFRKFAEEQHIGEEGFLKPSAVSRKPHCAQSTGTKPTTSKEAAATTEPFAQEATSSTPLHNIYLTPYKTDEIVHSAYDLLERLLDVNPLTRITAKEALCHPFFTDPVKKLVE